MSGKQVNIHRDFPKLYEWSTQPWKKQTEFISWIEQVLIYANGVHSVVGKYVAFCMHTAEDYFNSKMDPPDQVDPAWREIDFKLVAVAIDALPEKIKADCTRTGRARTLTLILNNIFMLINPGGEIEIEVLMAFTRTPEQKDTVAGVRDTMEEWMVARSRLCALNFSPLTPKERLDAMKIMVGKVIQKDEDFRMKWVCRNAMLGAGSLELHDATFANQMETWLRRELRGMESNECIRPLSRAMPAKTPIDWSKWGIADQQGGYRYRDPYKYYGDFPGKTANIYKVGEDDATFRERE